MARFERYNVLWDDVTHPLHLELSCIAYGGKWKKKSGGFAGNGMAFHFKKSIELIWPEIQWHRWNELLLEKWLEHKCIGVMGPTNSGKSNTFALLHLISYFANPTNTTVIVCSTTKERLEDRIWGELKKFFKLAKERFSWLPGHLIEGRQRIITNSKQESVEGRDFRNGLLGVPCKKGGQYVGLGDFIGIKNEHLYLCGDELQLLPKAFIDSIPNLIKNPHARITGLGNPKECTDALGALCEPAASIGGWDGGIDQTPKTKSWSTRWPEGICIQLCGLDSPNTDAPEDVDVPYRFLITRKQIADDARIWGANDWHYSMFDLGMMPRGQGSRRVITRQLCERGGAFQDPRWNDSNLTSVTFLDAAYRAVGGDRCVFGHLKFGREAALNDANSFSVTGALINQAGTNSSLKMIMALISLKIIPITAGLMSASEEPEDQIVSFVKAENEALRVPPQNFFYDSGMRTSLVQCFGRKYSTKVNSIDCGGRPSPSRVSDAIDIPCCDYYSKFITELWYSVRLIIEGSQFRGMTEDLMLEGCAREWKTVSGNKIEVESKAEMKEKTGRSPDLFDALAIGCYGARKLGFRIGRMMPPEEIEEDERWKTELREKARTLAGVGCLKYES